MKFFINKQLHYNFLSLINVILGFLFITLLGKKFGTGNETDIYFLSLTIIIYLGYIIQSVWSAVSQYYSDLRLKDTIKSSLLYSVLLNNLVVLSLLVIMVFLVITNFFNIFTNDQQFIINVFIFNIIFQNIMIYNKSILLLEGYYALFYFVDIVINTVLFISLFFINNNLIYIVYITLIVTFIINILQFYILFYKININYTLSFIGTDMKNIYFNSIKFKIGSLFYGSKELIIASIFLNVGEGMLSIYTYANKFASVILQIVNAPIINMFFSKTSKQVSEGVYSKIHNSIKKVLFETIFLYFAASMLLYIFLPDLLKFFFYSSMGSNITTIMDIFIILIIFYAIVIIESPFSRLMIVFKCFNHILFINFVFSVIIFCYFILSKYNNYSYYILLYVLILAQTINLILYYYNYKTYLKSKT